MAIPNFRKSTMNLVISYAKIPMSFFNLYRQRQPQHTYSVAIACVMSTIFVINLWTLILLLSFIDRDWVSVSRRVGAEDCIIAFVCVLAAEIGFVYFVQRKVAEDINFAERVRNASPAVSICYTVVSVALLAALAVLAI